MSARGLTLPRLPLWGLMLAGPAVPYAEATLGAPDGTFIGDFDFYVHATNPEWQTFPDNKGLALGMTLMPDGSVAVFLHSTRTGEEGEDAIYTLSVNAGASPEFSILSGPIRPVGPPDPEVHFGGGLCLYANEQFALLGQWREDIGGGYTQTHWAVYRMNRAGGTATLLTPLPDLTVAGGPGSYTDLVHLPAEGLEPECFVLATAGPAGSWGMFRVVSLGGAVIRDILYTDLFHQASIGNLSVSPDGTLLAIGLEEDASAFSWNLVNCFRFDRLGNFRGAFCYGSPLPSTPFKPPAGSPGAMVELPNGDILSGGRFADYIVETGDTSGITYRHFVIRPPLSFSTPDIEVSPDEVDFPTLAAGESTPETVTIENVGAAILEIDSIEITGSQAHCFRLEGPTAASLTPSYGVSGTPGSAMEVTVHCEPPTVGPCSANLVIRSNDPDESPLSAPLSGFVRPATHSDTAIFDTGSLYAPPHGSESITFGTDPSQLIILYTMRPNGSPAHGRAAAVPAVRDGGGNVTGFNVAGATVLADSMTASTWGILQGPDGILWHGSNSNADPTIHQRKPAGGSFSQTLPILGSNSPRDFAFTPDGTALLVVRHQQRRINRFGLSARTDGFWDLVYTPSVDYLSPTNITALETWPRAGGADLLISNGDLVWIPGSDGLWSGGTLPAPPVTQTLVPGLATTSLARDPQTGDLLWLDSAGVIHRIDGLGDFPTDPPTASMVADHLLGLGWLTDWQIRSANRNGDATLDAADLVGAVNAE